MTITLKYSGHCKGCGLTLRKGDTAVWSKATKSVHCTNCKPAERPTVSQEDYPCSDMGYEDECARRCGY